MKLTFLCATLAFLPAAACGLQTLPADVAVQANIAYDSYPETRLDILQPKNSTGKRPGVLWIHGGGWVNGTKEDDVERWCLPYVRQGYVVANVEYRLAKAAIAPAAVNDVLKAARWFHDNAKQYNVDPNKIIVSGGSAGGHLALMVAMVNKRANLGPTTNVAAVVNFYGITDVLDQVEGTDKRDYAQTWIPANTPDLYELARRVSPQTYVRKDVPPILTIHGDADAVVPYEQGVELTRLLRKAKADAELIPVTGGEHGFTPEQMARVWPQVFAFLQRRGLAPQ